MANTASPQNSTPPAQAVGNTTMINGIQIHQVADTAPSNTGYNNAFAQANSPVYSNLPAAQVGVSKPQTVVNQNVPGSPYMGANAQQANLQAQTQAGVAPATVAGAYNFNQFGGSNTGGPSFSGNSNGGQQIVPLERIPATLAAQQQQAQQQFEQAQSNTTQLAPQALLQPQTQQAQQNYQQTQVPQFQQPQVGGFPVQQTQPQMAPTGNLSTPQTVTDPSQQPAPQIDPNSQVQAYNNATGQTENVSPDDPRFGSGQLMQNPVGYQTGQTTPQQNIVSALQSNSQQDFSSMLQKAMQAGPNTSGADLLKLSLQQQLGAIDDPNINTYLNNQIARTQQAYEMGMGYNSAQSNELQSAINGTLTSPQTVVGEQAKQAQAAKDLNLQSLSAQSAWNQAQQAATVDQLQTKRSDLEGFLKAQLALSAGSDTGPSTAALTVMSQSLHQADINMTLQNAGYTFGQAQLSIQGSKVMTDYTNQIMTLGTQVNQQRMQVTSDYYDGLNKIDQNALSNEQQKRQLTSAAYGDFAQKMTDLNNNQLNRQLQYAQLSHQTIQDNITDANQISGTTGIVYQPDGKGGFKQALDINGNPIQTLQSKQNQFTNANATAQLSLQAWNDHATVIKSIADSAISQGIYPGDPAFAQYGNAMEQLVGAPPGSITGLEGGEQGLNSYINSHINGASQTLTRVADGTKSQIPQGIQQIFNVGGNGGQCGDYASTLSTASKVPKTWNERIALVRSQGTQENPQPGYKMILPLGVNTDGDEPGHVETVISVDPNTGNMLLAQSNMDYKGTISMDIRNVNDLHQQYGNNWGFLPGQLKPGVQNQLSAYTAQNGSQINVKPQGQPNWDALGASIGNGNGTIIPPPVMTNFKSTGIKDDFDKDPSVTQYQQYAPEFAKLKGVESLMKSDKDRQAVDASLTNIFQGLATDTTLKNWSSNVFDNDVPLADKASGIIQQITAGGKQWTDQDRQKYIKMADQIFSSATNSYNQKRDDAITRSVASVRGLNKTMANQLYQPALTFSGSQDQQNQQSNNNDFGIDNPFIGTDQSKAPTTFNLSTQPPSQAGAKIQKALSAGYAPVDVVNYLQGDPAYGASVKAAQDAGYTPEEIINYMNQ